MNEADESSSLQCLLCESTETAVVQELATSQLEQAYAEELGISVDFSVKRLFYARCSRCGLLFFAPPVTGNEQFYGALQRIRWYYRAAKQEFRMAARYVEHGHHVLEIGAGRGLFTKEISPASYTGLEFSPAAISLAAEQGIRLLPQTIEQHVLANGARYDVVCSFQVLEHVASPRAFLEAAIGCLKPGGRLIVSVPGEDSFMSFAYWDVLNMPPHHVTRWTDACLKSIAPMFGLRLLALTPESLGRNMVRPYARAIADQSLATLMSLRPALLDARLRTPASSVASSLIATSVRGYLRLALKMNRSARRGHSVLAVFEK